MKRDKTPAKATGASSIDFVCPWTRKRRTLTVGDTLWDHSGPTPRDPVTILAINAETREVTHKMGKFTQTQKIDGVDNFADFLGSNNYRRLKA